jgi:3-deoxy-D-manno-octulosonic-acid transferase
MPEFFYSLAIYFLKSAYILASSWNTKAAQFVKGRRGIYAHLKQYSDNRSERVVWVHCASLGEFEQGRPVMESLKKNFPDVKILLTFLSPSGY